MLCNAIPWSQSPVSMVGKGSEPRRNIALYYVWGHKMCYIPHWREFSLRLGVLCWFILFLVFVFTGPARGRMPVTGALSRDSTLYYIRKVRGQNFPLGGDCFENILPFTIYSVTK